MTGKIHSFQSLGTVDGPGVRTVVFMQGCRLRCPYCHNPDTWDMGGGESVTVDDLVKKILRFKSYFGKDGGVTVSGGEPLLQAEFVTELFSKLKELGISTALDTAGSVIDDKTDKLLTVTDIVLLDLKYSTDEKYRQYIGISLESVLSFLERCEKSKTRVIIRQVITPTVNDGTDDIKRLKQITEQFSCVEKTELLGFHKLCIEKYEKLGIVFPFAKYNEADEKDIEELRNIVK